MLPGTQVSPDHQKAAERQLPRSPVEYAVALHHAQNTGDGLVISISRRWSSPAAQPSTQWRRAVKYRGCSGAVGGVRPNSMLTQARLSHLDRVLDRRMDKLFRLQLRWSKKKQRCSRRQPTCTLPRRKPGSTSREHERRRYGSRLSQGQRTVHGFMPRGSAKPVGDQQRSRRLPR
jgi:hypothetical protein